MTKKKYLTKNEVSQLVAAAEGTSAPVRNSAIITMAFRLGLRCSEISLITLGDVNLHERTVYVKRLKNGTPAFLSFTEEDAILLRQWLDCREVDYAPQCDALFISSRGTAICRKRIWQIVRECGELAGLGRVHPHQLRHAFGYHMANRGTDTRLLQSAMGHRQISSTVIYTETNAERFRHLWD